MFCENCGMEIDNARFCPGCGAEQKSIVTSASVPVSAASPAPEAPEPASIPAAGAPEAASIPNAPTAPIAPQPSVIPNNGIATTVVPMGVSSSPTVVVTDESKLNSPKRKYTGGHIALCLITAAVMAGIAGMFAGLYFSLLWAIR